ncbi:MAG: GAF domain-containing protein [Smithellaceae bacterium]|nr:GAF domain-containing protein [Smithellaceae bacterium]
MPRKSGPLRAAAEERNHLIHIRRLTQISLALSAEKNLDKLLEMIVREAMAYTNADGGTLYTMSDDETSLHFAIVQNDTLKIRMGGTGDRISWSPVMLRDAGDSPNESNVSACAAISGKVVNIPDVYDAEGFNFEGTRKFDGGTGYRSKSMLVVPMRDHENDIIGVLQLLNAVDPDSGNVIPFSSEAQQMTEALASLAAVALTNNRLIHDLEILLESFVAAIAAAIDEKSPYTGGHVRRVAKLSMAIAAKINGMEEGRFADVRFDKDSLKELRIAAWMHDVGKVTTPEYIVDKATKLEGLCNRIEHVKARMELMKKSHEIELLKAEYGDGTAIRQRKEFFDAGVDDDYSFLCKVNEGSEFLSDSLLTELEVVAKEKYNCPIVSEDEFDYLSIRKGTLSDRERFVINNHAAVTQKILSSLPFPKKLRNVPRYASAHHEKLDGTGYPLGLKEDQLPLQARIIALADIFEALTAKDRPYKRGNTLSEALKIMASMARDRHIDPELYNLFITERIYMDYAQEELSSAQIDL